MDSEARIARSLAAIESEHRVRILYACESGSRAWGFASADSDYDVRFLYVHPTDWYVSIDTPRDVIERPITDDLDINGWELRKALRLMRKSNPVLLEWLHSTISYRCCDSFLAAMRDLAALYYSPAACFYHYLHMAQGNRRDYLRGPIVWLKKYLYVLRPVLACRWIEMGQGIPPVAFDPLVAATVEDAPLQHAIADLLAAKRGGDELARGPAIPEISDFLDHEMMRLERVARRLPPAQPPDGEGLSALLRRFVYRT